MVGNHQTSIHKWLFGVPGKHQQNWPLIETLNQIMVKTLVVCGLVEVDNEALKAGFLGLGSGDHMQQRCSDA